MQDNWALLYSQQRALQLNVPLHVVVCVPPEHGEMTGRHYTFMLEGLREVARECAELNISFHLAPGHPPDILTPAFLAELVQCLSFGKFGPGGAFDIAIKGYGLDMLVSQVANTALKEPKVGKNIPTVAKMTQGEVVTFAAAAADQMRADGMNVLMEGRAQTLNYVRTPHRFELMLSEPIIIGMRRAAQRMMAAALEKLPSEGEPTAEEVKATLADALAAMAA